MSAHLPSVLAARVRPMYFLRVVGNNSLLWLAVRASQKDSRPSF